MLIIKCWLCGDLNLEDDDIAGEEKSEENAEEEENIRPPAHMQSSDRLPW